MRIFYTAWAFQWGKRGQKNKLSTTNRQLKDWWCRARRNKEPSPWADSQTAYSLRWNAYCPRKWKKGTGARRSPLALNPALTAHHACLPTVTKSYQRPRATRSLKEPRSQHQCSPKAASKAAAQGHSKYTCYQAGSQKVAGAPTEHHRETQTP